MKSLEQRRINIGKMCKTILDIRRQASSIRRGSLQSKKYRPREAE